MGILREHRALAEEVSAYSRLCYDRHLVGAAGGNVSARVPGRDGFLITATGVSLRDVRPENLLALSADGSILDNPSDLKPSKETSFHLGIYRVKADVNAVIHVHPTYATAFSIARQTLPLVTVSAVNKLRQGPVVPEAPGGSSDLRDLVVKAVQGAPADATMFLMERHGLIAFGPNLCAAFDDAELAEDTAKIALSSAILSLASLHSKLGEG